MKTIYRLRPEPIKFVRLDSEHAQSDGKSVNRGLPLLDTARGPQRSAASGDENGDENAFIKITHAQLLFSSVPTSDHKRRYHSVKGSGNSAFLEKDQLFYLKTAGKSTFCIYFS